MNIFSYRLACRLFWVVGAVWLTGCLSTPEEKRDAFLQSGKEYLAEQDYPRAILQLKNATRAVPTDPEPLVQLSTAYLATEQYPEATAALLRAVEVDPKHAEAQVRIADLMVASRNEKLVEQAERRMRDLIALDPNNHNARFVFAAATAARGFPKDAEQELLEILKNDPSHMNASLALANLNARRGDMEVAEQVLKDASLQNPDARQPLVGLGQHYVTTEKYELADQKFIEALSAEPEYAPALLARARLAQHLEKPDQAESLYQQLSTLGQRRYEPLYAAFLMDQKRFDEAIKELKRLAEKYPNDRKPRTRLVISYLAAGQQGVAEDLLDSVLEKDSNDTDAILQRGYLYLGAKRFDEALADLNAALAERPTLVRARYLLAKVLNAQGETRRARLELEEVLQLEPDFLPARIEMARSLLGEGSSEAALEIMKDTPESQAALPPTLAAKNWALISSGQAKTAREEVKKALEQSTDAEFRLQDAVLKLEERDVRNARLALENVLSEDPDEFRAVVLLARSHAAAGEDDTALAKLRDYAADRPNSPLVHLYLGNWLQARGDREAARESFSAALSADPTNAEALIALGGLEASAGELAAARRRLETALQAHPKNLKAKLLSAVIAESEGRFEAATKEYKEILEMDRSNVVALNNLAYRLAEDTGQLDEALKYSQAAKELAPDSPAVDDTIGWIYYLKGLYQTALPYLERADKGVESAAVKYHLAMAYAQLGEVDRGGAAFEAASQLDSGLPEAAEARRMLEAAKVKLN